MNGALHRYLLVIGLGSGIFFSMTAVFNLVVDPLGAFPRLHKASLESRRIQAKTRVEKGEMTHQHQAEIVFLGTSRVKTGIPAIDPVFGTRRVLNLGVDGTSMEE